MRNLSDKEFADKMKEAERVAYQRKIERAMNAKPLTSKLPKDRMPEKIFKSLESQSGIALQSETKVYTGNKMVGIATMHKSNAVPVFNLDSAKDISEMK